MMSVMETIEGSLTRPQRAGDQGHLQGQGVPRAPEHEQVPRKPHHFRNQKENLPNLQPGPQRHRLERSFNETSSRTF